MAAPENTWQHSTFQTEIYHGHQMTDFMFCLKNTQPVKQPIAAVLYNKNMES